MKRELKVAVIEMRYALRDVEQPFPMKRELKEK